jgi:hypothetical protein
MLIFGMEGRDVAVVNVDIVSIVDWLHPWIVARVPVSA